MALKKFAYIRTVVLYKTRLSKFGPSYIYDKHLSYIKGIFSLVSVPALQAIERKEGYLYSEMINIFKTFFEGYMWELMRIKMMQKTQRLFQLVNYMQVRLNRVKIKEEAMT
jgi:hypothetical protein